MAGDIPAATAEDVELAVDAARKALARNKGRDWASASGAVRAKVLRAIAAKVLDLPFYHYCSCFLITLISLPSKFRLSYLQIVTNQLTMNWFKF